MRTRLQQAAAAALLATPLALAACGGGGGSGGPFTVNGIVVDSSSAPVSGANVLLNDTASSVVTTGADGKFSFAKVSSPYTLTVQSGTSLTEYRGLSRAGPQITFGTQQALHSDRLSGMVTGPTYPLPSDQGILLGGSNGVLSAGLVDSTTGAFTDAAFAWSGASSVTTDLTALRAAASGGLITAYFDTGKVAGLTLQDGVDQSGLTIALDTPVVTKSTTFDYDLGAYSNSSQATYLTLTAAGAQFLLVLSSFNIPSGTSVLLPDGGGTLAVGGRDADGNQGFRIGSASLGGTTTLSLPAATALANSLPANMATGVGLTPVLSWTPVSGASVYLVSLSGPGLEYDFVLPGDASSLTLPDYSALGLPLAAGTAYSWNVTAVKESGLSPNSAADPAVGGIGELSLYRATDLTYFSSNQFSFTTAP
ncbi:MAG TPA: carboxypeptidase-like regulatory domain-containing protein [Anaeromyxobacter sp.]|nr:carboxypeptidase-like regulatory domain-containing protein [Anaeromyxobacter sp.]